MGPSGSTGDAAPPSQGAVAFSVLFYMATSITMVMVNKWVLNSVSNLPLLFLLMQLLIAVALMYLASFTKLIQIPHWEPRLIKRIWPLIAINVLGLAVNTYCLKFVDASMYQVARSLVLPFTVALTWAVLHKPSSPAVISCCVVVFFGFLTGMFLSSGDSSTSANGKKPQYPLLGPLTGLLSSLTTAVHAVVIKNALDIVGGRTMDLVWWNNLLSAFALLPLVLLNGELAEALDMFSSATGAAEVMAVRTFAWGSIITGFFGFLINIAGFLQIKVTSPITHMVSGAVRGVLQTILAVFFFGDSVNSARLIGIALILAGSTAYTWVRNKETSAVGPSYQMAARNEPNSPNAPQSSMKPSNV